MTRISFAAALVVGWFMNPPVTVVAAEAGSTKTAPAIPWSQIGTKAGADYRVGGLVVVPTPQGARLRCDFQRLEGEATHEGLWLSSNFTNTANDRFRVVASEIGRSARLVSLPHHGTVRIEGQSVRFERQGLVEEYAVSLDGVRQDFVVPDRPTGTGELIVRLAVSGARVETASFGARLVLDNCGRKLAYSRLRATDANGKELPARMEVAGCDACPSALGGTSTPAFAVVVEDAEAAYPVRIDPTFSDANWISLGGLPGVDGEVGAEVVDDAGNLYIGGNFSLAGEVVANRVAQWNGTNWTALGSGMNGYVSALAVANDSFYAAGSFTMAGGISATNVAKWDGSRWTALGAGLAGPGQVYALAASGGNLYAGGSFHLTGVANANRIARWDGSQWTALGSGFEDSPAVSVSTLALSGNDLYVAGQFASAGGVAATNIAKWNGSTWSPLGLGLSAYVSALAVSGGIVYAGGSFTTADGVATNCVVQWDGNTWSALGTNQGWTAEGGNLPAVYSLALSGGELYAGGAFTAAGGSAAQNIAKWDGSSWSALGAGENFKIFALSAAGGVLYAGGIFSGPSGIPGIPLARWDGSGWSALGQGLHNPVDALAVSGNQVYVGGLFTTAGGVGANYVAKREGNTWAALGSGFNSNVVSLAVSGNDLYAGGYFTTAGGGAANYIARWNGTNWSALGTGLDGASLALAVSGNNLYAGGYFTTAGGIASPGIAKWDGTNWSALGSGLAGTFSPAVYALASSGGDLYVGGFFTTAGGNPAGGIAKWDGTNWSALGSGFSAGGVDALAVSGGNVYAGGGFTSMGGTPAMHIAKWNGSNWTALGSGVGSPLAHGIYVDGVSALAVSGGDVYASGHFGFAGGVTATCIARWDGTNWSALGSGLRRLDANYYRATALAVSGDDLYAGGGFTMAGGRVSAFIARAYLPTLPTLSVLGSGTDVQVSWPSANSTSFLLEQATAPAAPTAWVSNAASVFDDGTRKSVTMPATNAPQFFRLRRP